MLFGWLVCAIVSWLPTAFASFFGLLSMQKPVVDPCYNLRGDPVRCVPDFINAAFGKPVIATSTCGQRRQDRFCATTFDSVGHLKDQCEICDAHQVPLAHPASYLTDLNNPTNLTCWVSEPDSDQRQNVTLTLSLGKKFEVSLPFIYSFNLLTCSFAVHPSFELVLTFSSISNSIIIG